MKTQQKINALAEALCEAQKAADAFKDYDDGGSCNMDQVTIVLDRWRRPDIEKVEAMTGIRIGDKIGSSWWRKSRFIDFRTDGQASRNYKQVQEANRVMTEKGFNTCVFYQPD